jgi:hypothetical protein
MILARCVSWVGNPNDFRRSEIRVSGEAGDQLPLSPGTSSLNEMLEQRRRTDCTANRRRLGASRVQTAVDVDHLAGCLGKEVAK